LRTSDLPLLEWCKLIRAVKEFEGFTNQEVADGSDVSIKTIERIVALNCDQDIRRETARRIENFVLGDSPSFPCFLAFQENAPEVSQKVDKAMRDLEQELDEKHMAALENLRHSHSDEMLAIKTTHAAEKNAIIEENAEKLQYLRNQIQRLEREKDNLWAENTRKSRIIDKLIELQEADLNK
jgi:transcriptional regulator with XRE-family HTH domain